MLRALIDNWRLFRTAASNSVSEFMAVNTLPVFLGTAVPRYIFQAAFFVMLAGFAGGRELARFALLGNSVQLAANMALVGVAGVVESEKWIGTLPMLIAVPSSKLPALLGRSMAPMAQALVGVLFAFAGGMLLFRASFPPLRLLMAFPLVLLMAVTVSGLGMLIGAATLPTRFGTLMGNLVAYVMMVVCGVNIPLEALPSVIQSLSRLLPMTNGLLALRAVVAGESYADVAHLIFFEVGIGVATYAIAYLIFGYFLTIARKKGNLELF